MRFVIFIGQHKVGSTSLQMSLALNYNALLRAGILFPTIHNPQIKRDLKTYVARKFGIWSVPMSVWEAHNALAHRMISDATGAPLPSWHALLPSTDQIFANIDKQIKMHNPETVVICSETMSTFAEIDPALIARLAEYCHGHEVQILATLRRPDEYISSWHAQEFKIGKLCQPLREDGLDAYWSSVHFDYGLMLDTWLETFKDAQFNFINYADVLKMGGSIEAFWAASDLNRPVGMKPIPRANPSIPLSALELVRLANRDLPEQAAKSFRQWIIKNKDATASVVNNEVEVFGQTNRNLMMERFAPHSAYLDRITGKAPFFPDLDEMGRPKPIDELEATAQVLPNLKQAAANTGPAGVVNFLDQVALG